MTTPTLDIPKQAAPSSPRPKIKKQSKGEVADTGSLSQNQDDQPDQTLAQGDLESTFSGMGKEAGDAGAGVAARVGETSLRDSSKVIDFAGGMNINTGSAWVAGTGILALSVLGGEGGGDLISTGSANTQSPVITSATAVSFAANSKGTAYIVTATDADAGTVLTYALGGPDAALFAIDPGTGVVTFVIPPNFDAPADTGANNVYDLTVTASDGTNTSIPQAVIITVTNFTPVITSDATVSFTENGTGAAYTVTAVSADEGFMLTYALGGTDAALFTIDPNTGAITFVVSPDFETPADFGGNNVYDLTVTASHGTDTSVPQAVAITVTDVNEFTPVITSGIVTGFAENGTGTAYTVTATDADVGAVLTYGLGGTDAALFTIDSNTGVVTFVVPPDFETPADFGGNNVYDLTVTASHGTDTSVPQAVAITVTDVNEFTPVITSVIITGFAENGTGTAYTVTATDADVGAVLTYALGGADAALFTINRISGVVAFVLPPDFENPGDSNADNVYDLTVTASDGINSSSTQAVVITVTNVNEFTPIITSAATASFAENGTGTAYTVTASDADADTVLTYALGGADAALFTINPDTGAVIFTPPPDFEAPLDVGNDNAYSITVTANDGIRNSTSRTVTIWVTATNDTYSYAGVVGSGANIIEGVNGGIDTVRTTDTANLSALTVNGVADLSGAGTNQGIEEVLIATGTTATFSAAQLSGNAIAMNESADGATPTNLVINVDTAASANFASLTFGAFAGGNALDVGADTLTINGAGGAENITGSSFADIISGGAGNDTITGGGGTDTFVFAAGDSVLTVGGTGNAGTIAGFDAITDFMLGIGGDTINTVGASTVVADTTGTNGADSLLTIGGVTVKSHSITNGMITFDDVDTFAIALSLISTTDVAAVAQYLQANDVGNAGSTFAFTASIGGTAHTYLFTQGDAAGTNNLDVLVDMVGTTALGVSTTATANYILII